MIEPFETPERFTSMVCIGCGFDQLSDFAFCPRCGRRQPVPCASCGFSCDAEFAFCPRCGTAQSAPLCKKESNDSGDSSAVSQSVEVVVPSTLPITTTNDLDRDTDRRQVTVLFADVSGFTTLAERLDPEEVRAFQNALFETLSQAIVRYDGFVAKFLGDAVLALFGAPVAHEDDPERALWVALDMLSRSAELSDRWANRLGQPVTLHVAVHTGPVVAGSHSGGAGAGYDVTGDTVNTASRMLGAAESGTILISDATHALTRHRFASQPAGELKLRGKAEQLAVHRLLGARAEPVSSRGLEVLGLTSPTVGREEELNDLLGAFERMQRGKSEFVSLIGDAGVGKSRLIAEFLGRLQDDEGFVKTTVRRANCSSLGEPAYGVFATLFREAYHVEPSDSLEVARQKLEDGLHSLGALANVADAVVPVLSYLLGVEEAHSRDFDPEQLKRHITLATRMLVERRLEQSPVMILVEDLHWADAASVDLLRDLVDHFAERRLMVLVSHRPDTPAPLVDRATRTIVRLSPLSKEEARALVKGLFGQLDDNAFAAVQNLVAARAEGNPLFIEEIVRTLVSTGKLVRRGDFWTCAESVEAVTIPATLRGLLLSRVDRLPADARRLLQEAAVIGMVFDEALLIAVSKSARGAPASLHSLLEADVIRKVTPGSDGNQYRFTHALAHEAVYENLLISRRSELHERAGRALERAVGSKPSRLSDLEALGHHWSLASDKRKGARYLIAAGDWARAVYANDDAIRHYEHAMRILIDNDADDRLRQEALERLADVLALTGRRSDALLYYETARKELEATGDRTAGARLYRKIGGLHWEAGDRERAQSCFASGLDRLGKEGSPIERAQLFQEMGRFAFRGGDNSRAIEWAERALAEVAGKETSFQIVDDKHEIAITRVQAYNTLGVALARMGRLDEAVDKIEQSVALAESNDLLPAACRGYTNLGVLYSSLNPQRSIETCRRGLEIAIKVGDLGFQSRLYANLAVSYCALTDRCEADGMEAARLAIDLDRKLGLLDHLAVPLIVLGQIHQCHGDHALACASYEEALTLAERVGDPQLLFPCYDGLATLSLDSGNVAMAEAYLRKSHEVCERAGIDPEALMVLPFFN